MRRRDFIALTASAAAWPLAARAQSQLPVVGFLHNLSTAYIDKYAPAFGQGLNETGYAEGRNVTVEYRSAEGNSERLPQLVAELIRLKPAVIVAVGGSDPAKAAMAATASIPIVFGSGADAVKAGLVASINRPGGNVTGVSIVGSVIEAKALGILQQLVPGTAPVGILVNPNYSDADIELGELQQAAATIKRQTLVARATTAGEIDTAFATFAAQGVSAVLVTIDPLFSVHREQIATLAAGKKLPAIYPVREFVAAGGLMSYGADLVDTYRQIGVYVGRILKGEKPADLPVVEPTKFELVINLKAAKAIGLDVPPQLIALADEVIE
jgi:putative ABC transport system substrate-binding protein